MRAIDVNDDEAGQGTARRWLLAAALTCAMVAPLAAETAGADADRRGIDGPAGALVSPNAAITTLQLSNVSTDADTANVTFGQVFARGDVPAGTALVGTDDRGADVPLQVDAKATHADGSLRHAVITTAWNGSDAHGTLTLRRGTPSVGSPVALQPLLDSDFDAVVSARIGGTTYSNSAKDLLSTGAVTTWLEGPLVTEFHVAGPLATSGGGAHSHLTARYNIRVDAAYESVRVDVIVENTVLEFFGGSLDFTYDATVTVGADTVVDQDALTHYHNARWRHLAWWGHETRADVTHDTGYLIDTKAVPNYDQSVTIDEAAILADVDRYDNGVGRLTDLRRNAIMGSGMITEYMPGTGGRPDLAPLPRWTARYLLSMDQRAKDVTLGTGDQAGSFRIHTRHPDTGLPMTAEDEPDATTHSNFRGRKNYIGCATCISVYDDSARYTKADTAHQPSMAYVPYLVTGDHYYLEELQFWAGSNPLATDPGYRQGAKGLVDWQQVRAQAWSLRTLSHVAYITPDDDANKDAWVRQLGHNIDRYTSRYVDGADDNALGIIPSTVYNRGTGVAPWQNDYLTWSFGQLVELGFSEAAPMQQWLARFPTQRMVGDGFCWILGSKYTLDVRSEPGTPILTNAAQVYAASADQEVLDLPCASQAMADELGLRRGEMLGYSASAQGYPAIMQSALASAVDAGLPQAQAAWNLFETRSVKPDYGSAGPEFAIVPRQGSTRGVQLAPASRLALD